MPKNRIVLGTRKGLLVLDRNGRSWQVTHSQHHGVPFSHVMVDPRTGTIWACADHGHWGQKLYRSDDGGENLTEVAAPQYPEGSTIFNVWQGGTESPATVTYIWTIVPGGQDQPGTLYIGTEPGGLFRSDDDGQSWVLVEGLWDHESRPKNWMGGGRDQAGACSIVVDPRNSNHLIVGISVGGVYESFDGGETWHGRNKGLRAEYLPDPLAEYGHDPHCIVAAPSSPDVLWQQNHCGVYRSLNSGQEWEDVSEKPIYFGFPIVVDENDPDTAWVVPAISDEIRMAVDGALFVGRTEDGGQTWQHLRNGLPQENCYDIVFRHALDLDGNQLIFGSTCGNLFYSDNRGDSWENIGHYFPPIYSARFA